MQDPRRKSVENLLQEISKPIPAPAPAQEPKPKAAAAVQQQQQQNGQHQQQQHQQYEQQPPPQDRTAGGTNTLDDSADDVERFLDQIGLSADLAESLRAFGLSDEERLNKAGRLSDESLGLMMAELNKQGVDMMACIIVREELKRRRRGFEV